MREMGRGAGEEEGGATGPGMSNEKQNFKLKKKEEHIVFEYVRDWCSVRVLQRVLWPRAL